MKTRSLQLIHFTINNTFSVQNRVLESIPASAIAASTQDELEKWWLLNASSGDAKCIGMMMTEKLVMCSCCSC